MVTRSCLILSKNIFTKNLKKSNLPLLSIKTILKLWKKVNNIKDKYNYLEILFFFISTNIQDICFIINITVKEVNDIINIFYKSQKQYFVLINNFNKYRKKKAKIYNYHDLNYDRIESSSISNNVFNLYYNRFIYRFTRHDFIKIIYSGIFNYSETYSSNNLEYEITITYNPIKNPYTNIPIKKSDLYNFYNFLYYNNHNIPNILKLWYYYDFDVNHLYVNNLTYIIYNTFKIYVRNLNNSKKQEYIKHIIKIISTFLFRYVDIFQLKRNIQNKILDKNTDNIDIFYNNNQDNNLSHIDCYLDCNLKNDINNIYATHSIYDKYICYYLLLVYYSKTNNAKAGLYYKFRLVFEILEDKNIDFLKNYLNCSKLKLSIIVIIQSIINEIYYREYMDILSRDSLNYQTVLYNVHYINSILENLYNNINQQTEYLNTYGITVSEVIVQESKNIIYKYLQYILDNYYVYYSVYYKFIIMLPFLLTSLNCILIIYNLLY